LTRIRGPVLAMLALTLGAAACGGDGDGTGTATAQPRQSLVYAVASRVGSTDPLLASTRSARVITAQIHEPLVEELIGPYGDTRPRRGLAASWSHSPENRVWRFRLRRGVRFQDGSPFNASAVVANARRWRRSPVGRRLLPGLRGADAPTPRLVRFLLSSRDARFPRRLADVRLGLVAPATIGGGRNLSRDTDTGAGPFEVREREGSRVLLARNPGWWGTAVGLGPALDRVEFRAVGSQAERLTLLRRGEVQVADQLDAGTLAVVEGDPLLETLSLGSGPGLGLERSVRELPAAPHGFGGVWLTRVGQE
jgi:peptide/nickel transport system substrate-binding protein